jgi:hypothetical protein
MTPPLLLPSAAQGQLTLWQTFQNKTKPMKPQSPQDDLRPRGCTSVKPVKPLPCSSGQVWSHGENASFKRDSAHTKGSVIHNFPPIGVTVRAIPPNQQQSSIKIFAPLVPGGLGPALHCTALHCSSYRCAGWSSRGPARYTRSSDTVRRTDILTPALWAGLVKAKGTTTRSSVTSSFERKVGNWFWEAVESQCCGVRSVLTRCYTTGGTQWPQSPDSDNPW